MEKGTAEKLEQLFINRSDVYAEAYLTKDKNRMGYKKVQGLIDSNLIQEHIEGNIILGVYQLSGNKVKWACLDFDLNTAEDYENAKKLFLKIKEEGLNPLMELSGGGEYKVHIWIFADCLAEDIKNYLEHICEKSGIKPHEIFPKQIEAKEKEYGNLVKLPLAVHLVTGRRSSFFDNDFNIIIDTGKINEQLDFHLNNKSIIPKVETKEKPIIQNKPSSNKPSEFDSFFNFMLRNELPAGKSAKEKKYEKIVGVNDNLVKNQAIWFYQKGYSLEQLEQEIKPIYEQNRWEFGGLKGWYKWILKEIEEGNTPLINAGEIAEYLIQSDRKNLLELIPQQYKKVKLSDLNASLVNKFVEVDCQITGEQSQKAIPDLIVIKCQTCGMIKMFFSSDSPELFVGEKLEKTIIEDIKKSFMCNCVFVEVEEGEEKPVPHKTAQIKSYVDFSVIYCRDLLDREDFSAVKRFEAKRVYVINQLLPNAKTINIKGKVIIEPKTKNLSIVCNFITPLKNQAEDFQITEEFKDNSRKYFNSNKEENNLFQQINPDIVGKTRELAKQSIILQLHSPCRIYDIERNKQIRGGLNVLFYGDTKCAKSDLAKDVTNKGSIPVGEYTICETGGRTGFLYTIDNDRNALIWGSLVLNDTGLVVLDGLQAMHSEELGEFREAIEGQEVNVKRSLSGEALARTRILASFNPNKPMNNYIYKCQAITDSYVFSKTPDITRWDIAIPFCLKDVSSKEIAHRKSGEKPVPQNIFINHIYWVWSRKPEHIIYTDSSVKKINDFSEELIETYSMEALPLVHNGVRDIITRLSVAQACLMHSTDETQEKVIVETEHVERAVKWYKEVLEMLELAKYKQDTEGKSELTDNDCIAISKDLGEMEWNILEEIKHEGKSSPQLSEIFEVDIKTIKRHYELLRKHRLAETRTGKGIALSVRGVKFVRWGMLNSGDIGTNDVPKKTSGDKKSPYVQWEKPMPKKRIVGKKPEEAEEQEETEK